MRESMGQWRLLRCGASRAVPVKTIFGGEYISDFRVVSLAAGELPSPRFYQVIFVAKVSNLRIK